TTTLITGTWSNMANVTVTLTDITMNPTMTLCSASTSGGGGQCTWTIDSTEGANIGNHTIQASDGNNRPTQTLNVVSSVDGLGDSGLLALGILLVGATAYRIHTKGNWPGRRP